MSAKTLLLTILAFFVFVNTCLYFNKYEVNGDKHALFGSYGMMSKVFKSKDDTEQVFFIGNSVYYGTSLLPELNKLQESQAFKFQIGNFGFTGASLYDYLFTYNHVKQFKPDLLVVQLAPISFGYGGPHFRNDGKKGIFKMNQIKLIKNNFVRDLYDRNDLAEALTCSIFPLAFQAKLLSSKLNIFLQKKTRRYTPLKLWSFFPVKLNISGEWAASPENREEKAEESRKSADFPKDSQYSTAKQAFIYFRDQLIADNQKTLFILQPNDYYNLPIMGEIEELVKDSELFFFDDQRKFYIKKHYNDKIHPNKMGSILAARKHYKMIKLILDK